MRRLKFNVTASISDVYSSSGFSHSPVFITCKKHTTTNRPYIKIEREVGAEGK